MRAERHRLAFAGRSPTDGHGGAVGAVDVRWKLHVEIPGSWAGSGGKWS